jgi:hypothetical protein
MGSDVWLRAVKNGCAFSRVFLFLPARMVAPPEEPGSLSLLVEENPPPPRNIYSILQDNSTKSLTLKGMLPPLALL